MYDLRAKILEIRSKYPSMNALDHATRPELLKIAAQYGVLTPSGKPSANMDKIADAIHAAQMEEEHAARLEAAQIDPESYADYAAIVQQYNPHNGVTYYAARRVIGAAGETGVIMPYTAPTPAALHALLLDDGWSAERIIDRSDTPAFEAVREKQRAEYQKAAREGGKITGYTVNSQTPMYQIRANVAAYRAQQA